MCVKWGNSVSDKFKVLNRVKQGGILSSKLFNLYMDDLKNESKIGCNIAGK